MVEFKGVLFDLDGVILDTEGIYTQFWDAVELRYPTRNPAFSSVIKGSNLHEILYNYYRDEETRRHVTEMLDKFQASGMKYDYFPGVKSFIDELNDAGIPACIVTSSDQKKMNAVNAPHPDYRGRLAAMVTGENVTKAKPDPECFVLGARLINCSPHECLIFEDSINGLKAARAAGGCVVGLPTTNPRDVVSQYADVVLESFENLTLSKLKSQL